MKPSTFLSALAFAASALAAPATVPLGKRLIIMPAACSWTDPSTGTSYDLTKDLTYALAEAHIVITSALKVKPEAFGGWYDKMFPNYPWNDYHDLAIARSAFSAPREYFSPIKIECAPAIKACEGLTEPDGSPRLMVADAENDQIYACPELFRASTKRKLIKTIVGPGGSATDLVCPDAGGELAVDDRISLEPYGQFWATVLIREIAHTGSAIRKVPGARMVYTDKALHGILERVGWADIWTYFMDYCGYEIPLYPKGPGSPSVFDWVKEAPVWNEPKFF